MSSACARRRRLVIELVKHSVYKPTIVDRFTNTARSFTHGPSRKRECLHAL